MTHDNSNLAYSPDPTPWAAESCAEYQPTTDGAWRTISEVAREYGVTERALRFYEAKGLLTPSRDGTARRYGPREYERLALMLKAKKLGFTLAEIRQMLAARVDGGVLDIGRRQCVEQIRLLEQRKRDIEFALAELRRAYSSLYMRMAPSSG